MRRRPTPEQIKAETRRKTQRARYRACRAQVFARYGEACACCGSAERLTIDHVGGGGRAHRIELFGRRGTSGQFYRWLIKNNFPAGFQTLCLPCNSSKFTGDRCRLNHTGVTEWISSG